MTAIIGIKGLDLEKEMPYIILAADTQSTHSSGLAESGHQKIFCPTEYLMFTSAGRPLNHLKDWYVEEHGSWPLDPESDGFRGVLDEISSGDSKTIREICRPRAIEGYVAENLFLFGLRRESSLELYSVNHRGESVPIDYQVDSPMILHDKAYIDAQFSNDRLSAKSPAGVRGGQSFEDSFPVEVGVEEAVKIAMDTLGNCNRHVYCSGRSLALLTTRGVTFLGDELIKLDDDLEKRRLRETENVIISKMRNINK